MFENFEYAKTHKRRAWATALLAVALFVHITAGTALGVHSMWVIHKLDAPKRENTVAIAPPPPPPPKGNPGHKMKDPEKKVVPVKRRVTETVQPVKIEPKVETAVQENTDPDSDPNGEEGGQAGGVVGGVITSAPPPPPPPPPPPAAPQIVPPAVLQGNRISGDPQIIPDDVTKTEIQRSGKTRIIASAKLCLDKEGNVASVNLVKSSGFPSYDDKIRTQMNGWRYRPFTVNGAAVQVCTAITFIYQQH
jgi:periplasmic protein TonB